MTLEKNVIKNNQSSPHKEEVYKAIQALPENTINSNGETIPAIRIIPTDTCYIKLENKNQINIPGEAQIKNHYPDAIEFKYKSLNYLIHYGSQ